MIATGDKNIGKSCKPSWGRGKESKAAERDNIMRNLPLELRDLAMQQIKIQMNIRNGGRAFTNATRLARNRLHQR